MSQFGSTQKCVACEKTVYPMEKIEADGKVFHKSCLKCTHCNGVLKLGNYAALNGKYYCKTHFKQLFKEKGNYSEGFGEEDAKKKWAPQVINYSPAGRDFSKLGGSSPESTSPKVPRAQSTYSPGPSSPLVGRNIQSTYSPAPSPPIKRPKKADDGVGGGGGGGGEGSDSDKQQQGQNGQTGGGDAKTSPPPTPEQEKRSAPLTPVSPRERKEGDGVVKSPGVKPSDLAKRIEEERKKEMEERKKQADEIKMKRMEEDRKRMEEERRAQEERKKNSPDDDEEPAEPISPRRPPALSSPVMSPRSASAAASALRKSTDGAKEPEQPIKTLKRPPPEDQKKQQREQFKKEKKEQKEREKKEKKERKQKEKEEKKKAREMKKSGSKILKSPPLSPRAERPSKKEPEKPVMEEVADLKVESRPICEKREKCDSTDPDHWVNYQHTPLDPSTKEPSKEPTKPKEAPVVQATTPREPEPEAPKWKTANTSPATPSKKQEKKAEKAKQNEASPDETKASEKKEEPKEEPKEKVKPEEKPEEEKEEREETKEEEEQVKKEEEIKTEEPAEKVEDTQTEETEEEKKEAANQKEEEKKKEEEGDSGSEEGTPREQVKEEHKEEEKHEEEEQEEDAANGWKVPDRPGAPKAKQHQETKEGGASSGDGAAFPFEVKALDSYKASNKEELSFSKNAVITVEQENAKEARYYGVLGKKKGWFPCYYVLKV